MKPFKYNPNNHSGMYRHRITLQRLGVVLEDELGQSENQWENIDRVWCMIKTVQGREYLQAAMHQSENKYRFIIRYQKGIDSSMRLIYDGRIFNIESVLNDDEMNSTLTIIGVEKGESMPEEGDGSG